jgi:hypothetical protein
MPPTRRDLPPLLATLDAQAANALACAAIRADHADGHALFSGSLVPN